MAKNRFLLQTSDGYSGIFLNIPQDDREKIHARYHFECQCVACQQQWPIRTGLPKQLNGKDKKVAKLKFLMKQKDKASLVPDEKFQLLKEAITLAYQCLKRPHLVICNLEADFYNQMRILH